MRGAALLGLALAASLAAGRAAAAPAKHGKGTRASGTVVSADPQGGRLVVTGSHGERLEFVVTEATRVASGGRPLTLGEVRSGERVSVLYEEAGGVLTARTIVVLRPREKPEKPAKPPKPPK